MRNDITGSGLPRLHSANKWLKIATKVMLRNEDTVLRLKAAKIALEVAMGRAYDPALALLPQVVHNDDPVILDIGANMGQFACRLSRLFPKGRIHSFEPLRGNLRGLYEVTRWLKSNNIEIHEEAICDRAGIEGMHIPVLTGSYRDGALAVLEHSKVPYRGIRYDVEFVTTNTIDAFVATRGIARVDLIKIDTEGAEERVVMGGMQTIERFRPAMYVEMALDRPWLAQLYELGYQPYYCDGRMFHKPRPGEQQTNVLLTTMPR